MLVIDCASFHDRSSCSFVPRSPVTNERERERYRKDQLRAIINKSDGHV